MTPANWCEIYIDRGISAQQLAQLIMEISHATILYSNNTSRWELDSEFASLAIERNENRHSGSHSGSQEFLHFPLMVTSEPKSAVAKSEYEQVIRDIVQAIRGNSLRCEVVADFHIDP